MRRRRWKASGRISGYPTSGHRKPQASSLQPCRTLATSRGRLENGKILRISVRFERKGDCWELGVTEIGRPGCNGLPQSSALVRDGYLDGCYSGTQSSAAMGLTDSDLAST